MINIITTCLACWFWSETPPAPPPSFNAMLLNRQDLIYSRAIRICCLDNTVQRPMYYFKLEGFDPHQAVSVKACDFFTYDESILETDSKGKTTIIAFVKNGATLPDVFKVEFVIEGQTIGIEVYTKDVP